VSVGSKQIENNKVSNQTKLGNQKEEIKPSDNTQNKRSMLWAGKNDATTKKWETLSFETEDQNKFLKLLGLKNTGSNQETKKDESIIGNHRKEIVLNPQTKEKMNYDLERQFLIGLQRKDGRKSGLGK